MTVPPPPDPKALMRAAGLAPKKSWGQNFLRDQGVLQQTANAIDLALPVVELGGGLGALTHYLGQRTTKTVVIERDRDLAPILVNAMAWAPQVEVREADAAKLDYAALASELGGDIAVAGNLPYQLSSRLLVSLSEQAAVVRQGVFLVQREVADRLVATSGSAYGLLSVLVQRAYEVELLFTVPPGAFVPPPKVHSAVVRLRRRSQALAKDTFDAVGVLARAGFSQRRKMLAKNLSNALSLDREAIERAMQRVGLDPSARAETLAVGAWSDLAADFLTDGWLAEK